MKTFRTLSQIYKIIDSGRLIFWPTGLSLAFNNVFMTMSRSSFSVLSVAEAYVKFGSSLIYITS